MLGPYFSPSLYNVDMIHSIPALLICKNAILNTFVTNGLIRPRVTWPRTVSDQGLIWASIIEVIPFIPAITFLYNLGEVNFQPEVRDLPLEHRYRAGKLIKHRHLGASGGGVIPTPDWLSLPTTSLVHLGIWNHEAWNLLLNSRYKGQHPKDHHCHSPGWELSYSLQVLKCDLQTLL